MLAPLRQRMVHEPRQELHGEVLEGERRPVKQLQDESPGAELHQRGYARMAKGPVGIAGHCGEVGGIESPGDEGGEHLANGLGVRPPGQGGDPVGWKKGPGFRDIEPAIAGETGERHIDEAERGSLASGRNVAHGSDPSGRADQSPSG